MSLLNIQPKMRRTLEVSSATHINHSQDRVSFAQAFRDGVAANVNASKRLEETIQELLNLKSSSFDQEVYHVNAPSIKSS